MEINLLPDAYPEPILINAMREYLKVQLKVALQPIAEEFRKKINEAMEDSINQAAEELVLRLKMEKNVYNDTVDFKVDVKYDGPVGNSGTDSKE